MKNAAAKSSSNRIEHDAADERELQVDTAIAEFLQAVEAGLPLSVTDFLTRHASIADDLREFLANHAAFRHLTAPLLSPSQGMGRNDKSLVGESLPRNFGEFILLQILGRGGMGTVYSARRLANDEHVAIKVLHPWLSLDVTALQRFEREALAAMSLKHPHVVTTLGTGTQDGHAFLVMELVDGESLDQVLQHRSFASSTAAQRDGLVRQLANIADALQHAHDHGVMHRDVKPSNLLLTRDERLLIGDFGLARLTQQPSLTRTGEAVGSPTYMSPEQIASRDGHEPVDHRTDIYSLGAALYELLTGRPPFVAETRERLLASIQHDDPIPPRHFHSDLPCDIETICLKALEKRPQDRYATASEFAADLRRCVNGERIIVRRRPTVIRIGRWLTRQITTRPRAAMYVAALVTMSSLAAVVGWFQYQASSAQKQQAIDAAMTAALTGDLKATDTAIARAEYVGVPDKSLNLLRGQVAFHRGDFRSAIQHLDAAVSPTHPTVAPLALQASAQLGAGSWENYEALLDRAASLRPTSAEDFLFLGQAETYFDPAKAVRSLNEAVRRRDTPLARLVRAEARANLAFDSSDLPTAQAALADAFIARDMLLDHPAALLESLNAHVVAAQLLAEVERTGNQFANQRDAEWQAAQRDFDALEPFRHLPTVIHNRALFLLETGREKDSFELLHDAATQHDDPVVAYDYALALYRRGDVTGALQQLQRRDANATTSRNVTADEAFLKVLLLQEAGDLPAARKAYEHLTQKYQTGLTAYFRPSLLLLFGDASSAAEQSRQLQTATPLPRLRGDFYSRLLAFNAGDLSEADLLSSVRNSRWNRCESLFFAALHHLAHGDRSVARHLFEQCVATHCAGFLAWDWSHAILRRLEKNPQWPAWIP